MLIHFYKGKSGYCYLSLVTCLIHFYRRSRAEIYLESDCCSIYPGKPFWFNSCFNLVIQDVRGSISIVLEYQSLGPGLDSMQLYLWKRKYLFNEMVQLQIPLIYSPLPLSDIMRHISCYNGCIQYLEKTLLSIAL